jgi:hypothetical protein
MPTIRQKAELKKRRIQQGNERLMETDKHAAVFLPDKERLVRMIAMRGATDDEIADTFGVARATFQKWRKAYPTFNDALEKGRISVDADVVVSLYKQATGFEYEEDVVNYDKKKGTSLVRIQKFSKPDTRAIEYWLNNRQPDNWRSSSTTRMVGPKKGSDDVPIGVKVETRNEIIESLMALVVSKPDGTTKPGGSEEKVKR